jgi:hypothetical protein
MKKKKVFKHERNVVLKEKLISCKRRKISSISARERVEKKSSKFREWKMKKYLTESALS